MNETSNETNMIHLVLYFYFVCIVSEISGLLLSLNTFFHEISKYLLPDISIYCMIVFFYPSLRNSVGVDINTMSHQNLSGQNSDPLKVNANMVKKKKINPN